MINAMKDEALKVYEAFSAVCTRDGHTDTGDAWLVLDQMAAALYNDPFRDLASSIDALAMDYGALEAFRKGWHLANDQGRHGSRVTSGLLNMAEWVRQQEHEKEDRCNPVHPDSPVGRGVSSEEYYGDKSSPESTEAIGYATPKTLRSQRDGTLGDVIDRRVQVYGDPVIGFAEIAAAWSVYLGHTVQAHEVPMMFILMKIIRSKTSPDYSDHSDDIEGYLDIFRKVIGEDMVKARTVNEYIEKKWGDS